MLKNMKAKKLSNNLFAPNPTEMEKQFKGKIQKEMDTTMKKMKERTVQICCHWMYDASISFHVFK